MLTPSFRVYHSLYQIIKLVFIAQYHVKCHSVVCLTVWCVRSNCNTVTVTILALLCGWWIVHARITITTHFTDGTLDRFPYSNNHCINYTPLIIIKEIIK